MVHGACTYRSFACIAQVLVLHTDICCNQTDKQENEIKQANHFRMEKLTTSLYSSTIFKA